MERNLNDLFVKQTYDPHSTAVFPPTTDTQEAIFKQCTFYGNWSINPNATIPDTEGIILWYPSLGHDAVFRMGRIPKGTTTVVPVTESALMQTSYALAVYPSEFGMWPQVNNIGGTNPKFKFNSSLAIPYVSNTVGIQVSPSLESDFTKARLISGAITLESTTISSGTIQLNGTISAAVVSDTRQVCQDPMKKAFDESKCSQACSTIKDVIDAISVENGVVSVTGPDIMPNYDIINWQSKYHSAGETQHFALNYVQNQVPFLSYDSTTNTFSSGLVGASYGGLPNALPQSYVTTLNSLPFNAYGNSLPAGVQCPIGEYLVTPWDIDFDGHATSSPSIVSLLPPALVSQAIRTKPIDETGCIDIEFREYGALQAYTPQVSYVYFRKIAVATHIFAVNDGTNVLFKTYVDSKSGPFQDITEMYVQPLSFKFTPGSLRRGFTTDGKYIGTYIYYGILSVENGNNGTVLFTQTKAPEVTVTYTTSELPGRAGPCHIVQYQNVGTQQTVSCRGVLNVAAVANSTLAPFVREQNGSTPYASDFNVLTYVASIYKDLRNPIRRNWSIDDYDDFVEGRETHTRRRERDADADAAAAGDFASSVQQFANRGKTAEHLWNLGSRFVGSMFGPSSTADVAEMFL